MKKAYFIILIVAFLFPAYGMAATAPAKTQTAQVDGIDISTPLSQGKTLAAKKIAVQTALSSMYDQLTKLSAQTQAAATQLESNGISIDGSQTAITAAATSLSKAKTDIATFTAITTPDRYSASTFDIMKSTATTAENSLRDAKAHLLDGLTLLKASVANL